MISSEEALHIILDNSQDFGIEEVPFLDAQNRVLKEDIIADRDFPPFDRVSMDGIAINFTAFANGKRTFKIEGVQPAGSSRLTLKNKENCFEVMTGAILPANSDTVIRYEDVTIKNGNATINIDDITANQNVHHKGKDRKQSAILIRKNTLLSPAEIGVLSTVGKAKVQVAKQPKVMIISTGDELVDIDQKPLQHQIRRSNVYTLVALLKKLNITAKTDHITDDKEILKQKINQYLNYYDVLLFSGAVSKGKYDFLPEVLDELGVQKLFHKVAQRPGKPFWFGSIASVRLSEHGENRADKKVCVFAFPGNPVSTFVGCLKYFYPWYKKSVRIPDTEINQAVLAEDFELKPSLTYFLQVKLHHTEGLTMAKPITGNGSGDLANLVDVDGFIELPPDKTAFKAGGVYPLITFR